MFHIPISRWRPQRRREARNSWETEENGYSYCSKVAVRQTDREQGEEHQPELADDTQAEGNPPPASLTFSSAPRRLTMPVLFTSFTVKGIPLLSVQVAPPLSLLRLYHITAYPAVFALNCWHHYFQMGKKNTSSVHVILWYTNCQVFNCLVDEVHTSN